MKLYAIIAIFRAALLIIVLSAAVSCQFQQATTVGGRATAIPKNLARFRADRSVRLVLEQRYTPLNDPSRLLIVTNVPFKDLARHLFSFAGVDLTATSGVSVDCEWRVKLTGTAVPSPYTRVGSATEPSSAKEIIQGYETARLDCEIYLIQNNARPWISRFKAESQPAPGLINYTPNPDPAFAPFADAFMSGIAPEFLKLFGTVYGVKPLVLTLPDARSMRIGPDGPGAGTETLFATIVCALDSIDPNWTATDTAKAEIPAMILSLVTDPSSYTSELCNLLTRIDPEWRMSSVSKQVGSQLVAMLGHNVWDGTSEDYIRRHKAICVLGDLRTAEAVPVLTNLLTADKHIVLRMDAAQTLKEITGKHFDYSQ